MLNRFYVFIRFLDFIIDGILRNTDSYSENENRLLKFGDKGLVDLKERIFYVF